MNRYERWLAEHPDHAPPVPAQEKGWSWKQTDAGHELTFDFERVYRLDREIIEASRSSPDAFMLATGTAPQLYGISAHEFRRWSEVVYTPSSRSIGQQIREGLRRVQRRSGR